MKAPDRGANHDPAHPAHVQNYNLDNPADIDGRLRQDGHDAGSLVRQWADGGTQMLVEQGSHVFVV